MTTTSATARSPAAVRSAAPTPPRDARSLLLERFRFVRAATERLAAPLSPEDQAMQSMPACSPTKWHRAHTTWFFETFVLARAGVAPFDPRYAGLFNSYYVALGERHARPKRGLLSRPSVDEIAAYRAAVDRRVEALVAGAGDELFDELAPLLALGLAHEEQHQELILTDILHALSESPLAPAYRPSPRPSAPAGDTGPIRFHSFDGGLVEVGAPAGAAFHFDNEEPRHRVWLDPFALGGRLVTVGELRAFARDGGYETASLWLSEGFDWVRANAVQAPGHARFEGDALVVFGLDGERVATDDEPITHVGYYEADALARYLGARLPTEQEWEIASRGETVDGAFLEDDDLRARPASIVHGAIAQLFGDAWEWTQSSYSPYPGYRPPPGAIGEYNGKFMVNQMVLRGGSCFTPKGHVRPSYRNFWHPETRFQMTGVRLARSE